MIGAGLADEVELAVEGEVARVTLGRPRKLNALTAAMLRRLEGIADALEGEDAIRVVILTGSGPKAFCAGADIGDWGALDPLAFGREWIGLGHRVFDRWARLRQPVLAVLNGVALGGGLELAATADLRVAEAHATLGLPEARVGTVPGWSGTQRLVRRFGAPAVRRLVLTGEPVGAEEALRLGLVDYVRPMGEGPAFAAGIAATIASRAPLALAAAKRLVNVAEGETAPGAVLELLAGALLATTEDGREGVAGFRERRPPVFRNR